MSEGCADAIDHVGVVAADLDAAAAEWAALGFAPQPLARHLADGVPTGTGNRNIMLRQGYIELLATIDPARPSATLARMLARHAGAHILTLAIHDADAALARLHRAGLAGSIATSDRAADPADPQGPRARFARIPLTDALPRLQLLRQITPELVWQERFLAHPNRAAALAGVVVAAEAPAEFAARLARVAGRAVMPDPLGGFALALPGGDVRVLPPEALERLLQAVALPPLPAILGVVVRTEDGAAAAGALPGVRPVPGGVLGRAGGVAVLFTG